jgi:hypothetical protein
MLCQHLFIQIFGDSKPFQKDEVINMFKNAEHDIGTY